MPRRSVRIAALMSVCAGVVLALALATVPRGLFSGDEGVKLIQCLGVIEHGVRDPAVTNPGREIDRAQHFSPLLPRFFVTRGDETYGIYPPAFIIPSAIAYRVFGFAGLYVMPLVAGVVSVFLVILLGMRATGSLGCGVLAGAVVVVCTPLSLNALVFNEHAPAVMLFLLAIAAGQRAVIAGACLGFAALLRPELLAAAPAFAVMFTIIHGWSRRLIYVAAIAGAVLGLGLAYNHATTGYWLPSLAANLATNPVTSRAQLVPLLFAKSLWNTVPGLIVPLFAVAIACAVASRFVERPRYRRMLAIATGVATLSWCALAWHAMGNVTPGVGAHRHTVGLFTTTPLLFLGLCNARSRFQLAMVVGSIGAVTAIFLTDADADAGGLQLGARHVLIAVPLLTISAVGAVRSSRLLIPVFVIAAAVSARANYLNLRALDVVSGQSAQLVADVRASGVTELVTSFSWAPQILAPLWNDHHIYLIDSVPVESLLQALRRHAVGSVAQILGGLEARPGLWNPVVIDKPLGVVAYRLTPSYATRDRTP